MKTKIMLQVHTNIDMHINIEVIDTKLDYPDTYF